MFRAGNLNVLNVLIYNGRAQLKLHNESIMFRRCDGKLYIVLFKR